MALYQPTWRSLQPLLVANLQQHRELAAHDESDGGFVFWVKQTQKLLATVPEDCVWPEGSMTYLFWPDRELTATEKARLVRFYGITEDWFGMRVMETLLGEVWDLHDDHLKTEAAHLEWWDEQLANAA